MELEKEIQQKSFKSEYQKFIVNIIYTNNWVQRLNLQVLKPFKLTSQQYNILRILRGQYPRPATITLLQDRMLDKSSNASRLVEKLKQKNLVIRTENPIDRRQVDVVINERGLELLRKIDGPMDDLERVFKNLSEEEARTLNNLLDKVRG